MQSQHKNALEIESPLVVPDPLAGDEMAFLWAISYSDLLMVLLTFFIIFFQFSEEQQQQPLERLLADLKTKAGLQMMEGGGAASVSDNQGVIKEGAQPSVPTAQAAGEAARDLSSLIEALRDTRVTIVHVGKKQDIIVQFPDDIYPLGEFNLTAFGREEVDRIMKLVEPYAKDVVLVFQGYTDEVPVRVLKQHVIDSNMVLSNLRSSHAVNYAVDHGFDPRWVYAQGFGEYQRKTRSLSVRIMERGQK